MPQALPGQPNLIGVIDALIDLFGASHTPNSRGSGRNVINTNSIYNDLFKRAENAVRTINSLNGGEPGLYALVLANKTALDMLTSSVVKPGSVYLNFLIDKWNSDNTEEQADNDDARLIRNVLNLDEYYIFILSRTVGASPFPVISNSSDSDTYTYQGLNNYPVARTIPKRIRENNIKPGSLVRVQYDNAVQRDLLSIVDIVEDRSPFTSMVMGAFVAESAEASNSRGETNSSFTGNHASGDAIPDEDPRVALHNAYAQLEQEAGRNDVDPVDLYYDLFSALGNDKLVLGILANAQKESSFNANAVSTKPIESSLGLWQFNVQVSGYINPPSGGEKGIIARADQRGLPESIKIPANADVIPYFAGGLLLKSKGVNVITPTAYDGTQDLRPIYELVTNPANQVDYIVSTVQNMLATLNYDPNEITAIEWADWFQIYFEQPGSIFTRAKQASEVASRLQAAGIVIPV
tara:strand:- start:1280 stop:2674 length:1395 start_codon:yes stop_codon:yes gene_type:complete